MSIEKFSLVHPLRVRWAEADMQGVVFNAHYLAYFDIAITEYWRVLAKGDHAWLAETFEHLFVVKSSVREGRTRERTCESDSTPR